ncbi:hypothetical protein EK21DRAFT_111755 [Setomelanomma holmii]|uniref:Ecp2 effector protein-like domain-containing protein n=1 Tax=Setomelanomma holmii TaxID=210430 RepID=A0A9P4HAJ3_9PLEO|nr:hypothetical protein EK21DRAFT_111755 [Setomelanomma holmii]
MTVFSIALVVFITSAIAQTNGCTGFKNDVGYCDTLTYIDRTTTSTDPPSVQDCYDACRGVLSDAGDWAVDLRGKPDDYRQNMVGYPCGFSIGPAPGQPKDYYFSMHNQDIVDILDEVNKRFAPLHGGRVAAEGIVRCEGYNTTWWVT